MIDKMLASIKRKWGQWLLLIIIIFMIVLMVKDRSKKVPFFKVKVARAGVPIKIPAHSSKLDF